MLKIKNFSFIVILNFLELFFRLKIIAIVVPTTVVNYQKGFLGSSCY